MLRSTLTGQRRLVTASVAVGLAWQGVGIAVPWIVERATDEGLIGGDRTALAGWCVVLVGLGAIGWVTDAARHRYVEGAGAAAGAALRQRLTVRVLAMSDDEVVGFGEGDIGSRMVTDTWTVWMWVSGIATFVTSAFTLVVVSVLLLQLDLALAAIGLAAVPLAGALAFVNARHHLTRASAAAAAAGRYGAGVESAISSAPTLKGLGAERNALAAIEASNRSLTSASLSLARLEAAWLTWASAIPTAAIAAGLWVGGQRVLDGTMTAGTLLAFVAWMSMLVGSTATLTSRLATRGGALAAARRLAELIEPTGRETAGPTGPDPAVAPTTVAGIPAGTIRCTGVGVSRCGRTVLADVELDLRPGSWTALTGPTGGGKSSLLRVLAGLDLPTAGDVRVAPHPADRATLVPQGAVLVGGRVGDVIRLGCLDATDDDVWAALDVADARSVVEQLGGIHGLIEDRGSSLSGGQRQRLAVAAAVLRRPTVLLLDDSTSALDEQTEQRVLARLREQLPATTVVVATHRPAAIAACDRVLVVAGGRVRQTITSAPGSVTP